MVLDSSATAERRTHLQREDLGVDVPHCIESVLCQDVSIAPRWGFHQKDGKVGLCIIGVVPAQGGAATHSDSARSDMCSTVS